MGNLVKSILILGAGGFAREVYWHLNEHYDDFVFFDDVTGIKELTLAGKNYRVVANLSDLPHDLKHFIVGVGNPKVKAHLVEKAIAARLIPAPPFIHPRAVVQDASIGAGSIITPNCTITTNVTIGQHVIVNINSTVGHDAILGNYVTINPGVNVSGNVTIGDGVVVGTGTVIREKAYICAGAIIGAQAAVIQDIIEAGTYVGIPAKRK